MVGRRSFCGGAWPWGMRNMEEDVMHTLYLLGNGFDLACGLPSHYSDYFNDRFSEFDGFEKEKPTALESLRNEFKDNGRRNIPSVWFFVFAYYHDQCKEYAPTWKDVESNIEEFVTGNRGFSVNEIAWKKKKSKNFLRGYEGESIRLICDYLWGDRETDDDDADVWRVFLKGLRDFETDFCNYLREAVKKKADYRSRANELFGSIRDAVIPIQIINDDESPDEDDDEDGLNVFIKFEYALSFNFTDPRLQQYDLRFANVHGSLRDGNAFFGIGDVKSSPDEACTARFTKAERSLSLGVAGDNTELDSVFRGLQSVGHVNVIKFFGLSLGEADYPYLKQYFDKADITKTNAGVNSFLGFYYTSTQNRNDLINSIDMLLRRYSDDTGYKPVGGLMHELLHTGRLAVQKLELPAV